MSLSFHIISSILFAAFVTINNEKSIRPRCCRFANSICCEVSNQCSWFAVGVAARKNAVVEAWEAGEEEFRAVHNQILTEATSEKEKHDPERKIMHTHGDNTL